MSAFQMTCSCGHEIKVDAEDRQEAVSKIQEMKIQEIMYGNAIAAQTKERHLGEPVPPLADIHRMIDSQTVAAWGAASGRHDGSSVLRDCRRRLEVHGASPILRAT